MMIEYKLIRSSRKTIALYIRNGEVEVRAPLRAAKKHIDKFVLSKEKWINEKLAASVEQREQRESFHLTYGDNVLYQGIEYPITAKTGNKIGFDDTSFYIPPDLSPEEIKHACIQIYRMLAKRDLPVKVSHFARRMGVTPAGVKINGAKSRWGSCSGKKNLNFSWRLIMADEMTIDYVVIHELAHITEMNHSDRFWAIVKNVLPDYKERQKTLKELQKKLNVEDWE